MDLAFSETYFDSWRFAVGEGGAFGVRLLDELSSEWRRGWDSNPRTGCPVNGFRDRPIRPLWHLSLEIAAEVIRREC